MRVISFALKIMFFFAAIGCYITKHGDPSRNCAFIHWETPAVSYAHRGAHLMLFSPEFIEIRNVNTGRLVQVIEGQDIRMLHCGPHDGTSDTVLAVMRGDSIESQGISERILELVETAEIGATPGISETKILWDEWDM
jgi:RHO1 GDP-GTP exchange protein 1/2